MLVIIEAIRVALLPAASSAISGLNMGSVTADYVETVRDLEPQ